VTRVNGLVHALILRAGLICTQIASRLANWGFSRSAGGRNPVRAATAAPRLGRTWMLNNTARYAGCANPPSTHWLRTNTRRK
jgi:hypothetical protein